MIFLPLLLCFLPSLILAQGSQFYFMYPSSSTQCDVVSVTWQNGTAPYTFYVVPIGGQPFQYPIPASAYQNGAGSYDIALQLRQGTSYVVFMGDANGVGTGGTSEVQIVGASSRTECLNTAAANQTDNAFSFSVSGVAEQCESGFALSWNGARENGPYNATVIPLDQRYMPYDVTFDQTVYYEDNWKLNLTTGTRFTVMMNSGKGYGLGGTGGIYQVTNGSDASCVSQTAGPTGSWPGGLATNTLPVASAPAQSSTGTHISGGAIAGIVIGVLAALLIVALAAFFLLRRKRRRRIEWEDSQHAKATQMDLSEGYDPIPPGAHGLGGSDTGSGIDSTDEYGALRPMEEAPMVEPYSTGFLTPSATNPRGSTSASSLSGDSPQPDGPGIAGPLPAKSRMAASHLPSPSRPSASTLSADRSSGMTYPPGATGAGLGEKTDQHPTSGGLGVPGTGAIASPSPPGPGHLRVHNPDGGLAAAAASGNGPAGSRPTSQIMSGRRERRSHDGPTFRRHEDAGRLEQEVVDLPPLYTDVPRDGPRPQRQETAEQQSQQQQQREESGLILPPGAEEPHAFGSEGHIPREGDTVLMSGGPPTGDIRRADGQ